MNCLNINYLGCIFIALGMMLSSCKKNDWFDVKSNKSLAVPTTLKDMQALMDNARVMNTTTPSRGEIASDGHYITDARASTLSGNDRIAYTWSKELPFRGVVVDWANGTSSGSYIRIYYSNLVLDGIKKIRPGNPIEEAQLNDIKAQALFHRAHAFYELAQVFVPPYELAYANNKFGIPLRLESDVNIPSSRSTIQQTYDQIINDLTLAKDLLPLNSQYKTRPSKLSVFALLARMYLSMENYEQAGIYSGLCLDSYSTLMDYKTISVTGTTNQIVVYNPEMIFYSTLSGTTPLTFANILIDRSLYDSYSDSDLRKKIFFNENASTKLITYKGTYAGKGFNDCFSGLATDEIFLIRAECFARSGKVIEAMKDLNTLLKTRWSGTYIEMVAINADDALRKILEERKKELILRGVRWSDLRRLNRDPRFVMTLSRTVAGKVYTLEPNSYKYTFPFPEDIIEETRMEQNPGWK